MRGFAQLGYKGDIFQVIEMLETYDMIVLGGVLEHLEKKQALQLLDECIAHSDNHLMVCVSLGEKKADNNICGRIYDKPVSFWSHEDFGPFVYPQKFLQYTTEDYGIFLVNKVDYIDHKIVELYPLPKNNGVNTSFNLREKFSLSRENISKIDFSRYAKYADNLERSNYFLERKFLEHYRLIAHLSTRFSNATLFDIGTNRGYSALALSYNDTNKVISYDIVECN